jgi:branched-chain amino acid transport system permease protein
MTAGAVTTRSGTAVGTAKQGMPGRRAVAPVLVLVVLAILPLVDPGSATFLIPVGVFFLVVLGLDVFLGHAGQVSLGQTLFMGLGAYGVGILALRWHVPTVVGVLVMAVVSAAVAYLLGRPFLRLRGYYLSLATLGLAVIAYSLANGLDSLTGGPSGLVGIPPLTIGSYAFITDQSNYYVLLMLGALAAWFVSGVTRSRTGRALAAIAGDHHAAAMLGVDPARYKTRAFVLAAVFASIGGSIYACYSQFVSPDFIAVTVAFNLVVMLALGGSRSIAGPLLGALLLQALPQAGQSIARYEPLIAGVVLVLVITYLPDGLWGGLRAVVSRYLPSRPRGANDEEVSR